MIRCKRFETEALTILEKGGELDKHFSECKTCIEEYKKYLKVKTLLVSLGSDVAPPPDWQAPIWESISTSTNLRKKTIQWWRLSGITAALIVIAVIFLNLNKGTELGTISVQLTSSDAIIYRGITTAPGDKVTITATYGEHTYMKLYAYREGKLMFSCDNSPDCNRNGNTVTATFPLQAVGEYHIVQILSNQPIELNNAQLNNCLLNAKNAGFVVNISSSIKVL